VHYFAVHLKISGSSIPFVPKSGKLNQLARVYKKMETILYLFCRTSPQNRLHMFCIHSMR